MAGIYRRSLGRLGRKESEISNPRSTPVDELSSWLADDVCTNCGASTLRGKLFCSEECRLADARQMSKDMDAVSLSPSFAVSSHDAADNKFRYACPPSPSLLAQLSPLQKASHLTSPALAAHQNSLPRLGNPVVSVNTKKRSSSQSTFSSISDSNGSAVVSTDPSTPSPASGPLEDESSDLDAIDFQLPPSVSCAEAVMLRKVSKPKHDSPPMVSSRSTEVRTPKSPLWYARRPSTTNARGSFYTSPAVIATSRVTATRRDPPRATSSSIDHSSLTTAKSNPNLMLKAAKDLLAGTVDTTAKQGFGKPSIAVRRNHSQDAGTRSPQAVHSVASSAGKTMRGSSPPGSRPFSPLTTDGCDRCRTLSNINGELDIYASSFVSSHSRVHSLSSDERQRGRTQSHKHSHSAAAALLFTQVYQPDEKAVETSASPVIAAAGDEGATPYKATPPRGRSQARGRSSQRRSPSPPRAAARRDSTPFIAESSSSSSPAPVSPRSHPISIRSPRFASGEETIASGSAVSRSGRPTQQKGTLPVAPQTRDQSRGRSSRRDRESRERRGSVSRSRSTRWVHKDCELSWAAYGHRDSDRGEFKAAMQSHYRSGRSGHTDGKQQEYTDPGFDDIDLELDDGDDESSTSSTSSSSGGGGGGGAIVPSTSAGSAESVPTRGRATRRI